MTLKARIKSMFPALVQVNSPLTLVKDGLEYTFGFDPSARRGGACRRRLWRHLDVITTSKYGIKAVRYAGRIRLQAGNYMRASSAADGTNYVEGT
jgi:hypothetical protein